MKKLRIGILVLAMMAMAASPSFAVLRKDLQTLKGKVVSVSYNRTEVTVKDNNTGKDVFFTVAKGVDQAIGNGQEVIVLYKVGTNAANAVRVVMPRKVRGGGMSNAATKAAPAAKNSWY